jgi:hypothetical protein
VCVATAGKECGRRSLFASSLFATSKSLRLSRGLISAVPPYPTRRQWITECRTRAKGAPQSGQAVRHYPAGSRSSLDSSASKEQLLRLGQDRPMAELWPEVGDGLTG